MSQTQLQLTLSDSYQSIVIPYKDPGLGLIEKLWDFKKQNESFIGPFSQSGVRIILPDLYIMSISPPH